MSQYTDQSYAPPNPNPFLNYASFSHTPALQGYDPYSNPAFYPPNYGSVPAQPVNYSDPNVDSSNWVVKQSGPINYPTAAQPLKNDVIASTTYVTAPNYGLVGQRLVNRFPKKKQKPPKGFPKKPSVNQSVRCELCKIKCDTVQVYEKHLSGKKHNKGLLNLYAPALKAAAENTAAASGEGVKDLDLEAKKQKMFGGTAAQSMRVCTLCNVVCTGEVAFSDHVAGRKHISKEKSLGIVPNSNSIPLTTPQTDSQSDQTRKRKSSGIWCDVCKTSCTSYDGLQTHIAGKKHQKNLQKIQGNEPTNSSAATAGEDGTIGQPPQEKKKKKKKPKKDQSDDMNTKKQKILETGTPEASLRTCTICNVVCNSETVFNSHLAGQKHAAMVKQAESLQGSNPVVNPTV